MEYIYTDASFSDRTGVGGAAVVAPKCCRKGKWFSNLDIKIYPNKENVIFCAACKCSDSTDAEKRALGIAFLAADDMLRKRKDIKVEIITDSLAVISGIITDEQDDPLISALSNLRRKENIIVSKVKAHSGHSGNELADKHQNNGKDDSDRQDVCPLPGRTGKTVDPLFQFFHRYLLSIAYIYVLFYLILRY